jgi:hypothetical protein
MKKKRPMMLGKGKAPMLTKEKKSSPSFGDRRANNPSKVRSVKDLVAQKKGADGTAIAQSNKVESKARKKRMEGVKF